MIPRQQRESILEMTSLKLRLAVLASTLFAASFCHADWQALDDSTTYFVDPATFRSTGRNASIWALESLQPPVEFATGSAKSKRVYLEADCQQYQIRTLAYSYRADLQGYGKELDSANPGYGSKSARWRFVSPNSLDQEVFSRLCLKPKSKPLEKPEPITGDAATEAGQGTVANKSDTPI